MVANLVGGAGTTPSASSGTYRMVTIAGLGAGV